MNKTQATLYGDLCKYLSIEYNGENMFGLVDVASLSVIFASVAVVVLRIRLELRLP